MRSDPKTSSKLPYGLGLSRAVIDGDPGAIAVSHRAAVPSARTVDCPYPDPRIAVAAMVGVEVVWAEPGVWVWGVAGWGGYKG